MNCTTLDCERPVHSKKLCEQHYRKQHKRQKPVEYCTVDLCNKPLKARGFCMTHYGNARQNGYLKIKTRGILLNKTPGYYCYRSMISRCYDKNNIGYLTYGKKGITVSNEWRGFGGFSRFIEHIGPRPSRKYSIDRINTFGNYEPGNVRWATVHEQAANTRRNLEYVGVSLHSDGYWQARLDFNGVELAGKTYHTKEEAVAVREYAEKIFLQNKFNLDFSKIHK